MTPEEAKGPRMRVDVARGAFVAWDPELQSIFGYSANEAIGQNVELIIPRELRSLHWRGFNRAVERGRLKNHEKEIRSVGLHKDGRLVPFRGLDILEFGDDGKVQSVSAVILSHGPAWHGPIYRALLAPLRLFSAGRATSATPAGPR